MMGERYGLSVDSVILKNINNNKLTLPEARLLAALSVWADGKTMSCWPSNKSISRITGMERKTIIKAVLGLEEKKLLRVKRTVGFSSKYTILCMFPDPADLESNVAVNPEFRGGVPHEGTGVSHETGRVPMPPDGTSAVKRDGHKQGSSTTKRDGGVPSNGTGSSHETGRGCPVKRDGNLQGEHEDVF